MMDDMSSNYYSDFGSLVKLQCFDYLEPPKASTENGKVTNKQNKLASFRWVTV